MRDLLDIFKQKREGFNLLDAKILWTVVLSKKHCLTGNTKHYKGNELLPRPAELRIVKHSVDRGFFLYYCDDNGDCLTDTYHESTQHAMEQAEFEFNVKKNEWIEHT